MSASVFSRLLGAARQARVGFGGGKCPLCLMGYRYNESDLQKYLQKTTPSLPAPGLLHEEEIHWPWLGRCYLGSIQFKPHPAAGGCTVISLLKSDSQPDLSKKLHTQFEKFCKTAGGYLPDSILRTRTDWPNRMIDRWLTFLWDCEVLDQDGDMRLLLTSDGFDASARAIERCRLNTDSPVFLPTLITRTNRSTERGEGQAKEASQSTDAARRLLDVFTNGLADRRLSRAETVLNKDNLNANAKLSEIDTLMPIPPTTSAANLGKLLGVSKAAIQQTEWYKQKRKGQRGNEIGRRREQHRQRSQQCERDREVEDDD